MKGLFSWLCGIIQKMTWEEEKKQLVATIKNIQKEKKVVLIGIDGRCASGKTTLGEELHEILGGNLFHMDDFFLRPEQRTKQRYQEPGGNVDRERFSEEVLKPLKEDRDFSYRPFDCKTMTLKDPVLVKKSNLSIVEGSYCLHPDLINFYDLKIFLDVSPAIQMKRIERRNPDKVIDFREKWIPYEERYFNVFHTRESSDIVLDTENAF